MFKVDKRSNTLMYQPVQCLIYTEGVKPQCAVAMDSSKPCLARKRTIPLQWAVAIDGFKPWPQAALKTKPS